MICLNGHTSSNWPFLFMSIPQITSELPAISETYDGHRTPPTSAVGTRVASLCGAMGEFMERRHFYNEIKMGTPMKLSEMMDSDAFLSFVNVFRQTACKDAPEIKNHMFFSTQVYNLFSYKTINIPAIFVSLTNKGAGKDVMFLPFRDTTGCSAHVNFEKALNGAIGELWERQCLLRLWIAKQVKKEIIFHKKFYKLDPVVNELINRLSDSG